ncbi:16S rRNA (guanine(966)-N(2))-methyltransferase RsmD [Natranaerobius trueperi]|uniref:16S rRNA (Guanine(966)-N(2))-methyltransferase RsmD n=1 Tax=Natranaerobius trueperi TaxID=759412 RepID=A0A226C161_9FIRM|nr:16S rRNA (guanine(966)-N(2))-methyltransferase RsmD [Natranaerobius trueperi]OWZ84179.1 16S rRNA (guanine(966)-N(2))-methyltransferase RsmD [Natranaerobius trueperi]
MRIISGSKKGKQLNSLKGLSIRPTQDRVKEAIFNIIGNVTHARVLDLFCGTGNFGLEALSRGAEFTTFVDRDSRSIKVTKKNINSCEFTDCQVIKNDVFSWLKKAEQIEASCYDIVFADPPYNHGYVKKLIKEPSLEKIITDGGLLIVEYGNNELVENEFYSWDCTKLKEYGDTSVMFLGKTNKG